MMAGRTYMTEFRERNGLTLNSMARICEVSERLLLMLEECDRDVTHPKIAERVGKAYELTPAQTEGLMPEHYRKSSPKYNPDLYKIPDDELKIPHIERGGKP